MVFPNEAWTDKKENFLHYIIWQWQDNVNILKWKRTKLNLLISKKLFIYIILILYTFIKYKIFLINW